MAGINVGINTLVCVVAQFGVGVVQARRYFRQVLEGLVSKVLHTQCTLLSLL